MKRDEREVAARLRDLRAPEEADAEERSWEVVRAAYEDHTPVRPDPRSRRLIGAIAVGAVALAIGLSPAGAKVGDLVSEVVGIGEPDAKPALRSLPAAGDLLVASPRGVWVARDDGSKRLLGEYDSAAWSPNGVYVIAAEGRKLVALEPDGDVRWTYTAPGLVRDPRWTGTAIDTRIAYRSGDDLRVITGDGSAESDHVIARGVAPVAPAWRPPGESKLDPGTGVGPYVLSYVDAAGQVRTVNADTGERIPTLADDRARVTSDRSPDGSQSARLDRDGGRDRLLAGGRVLFSAHGRLTGPTWSPDGRWLLVGWPAADQWLFIDVERPRHVVAFDRISEQFNPGSDDKGRFPRVDSWTLPMP